MRRTPGGCSIRRARCRWRPVAGLLVVVGCAAGTSCGADEVRERVIRELAVGSWACAPDAPGSEEVPFTVDVGDDGTFTVTVDPDHLEDATELPDELSGTWAIEDGDLAWSFDLGRGPARSVVPDFDALTLESTEFTLRYPGIFESNDGPDDPPIEQDFLVDAHGTDSVTLRVPGGQPWTCDRR
jgi:hypothetical protein